MQCTFRHKEEGEGLCEKVKGIRLTLICAALLASYVRYMYIVYPLHCSTIVDLVSGLMAAQFRCAPCIRRESQTYSSRPNLLVARVASLR